MCSRKRDFYEKNASCMITQNVLRLRRARQRRKDLASLLLTRARKEGCNALRAAPTTPYLTRFARRLLDPPPCPNQSSNICQVIPPIITTRASSQGCRAPLDTAATDLSLSLLTYTHLPICTELTDLYSLICICTLQLQMCTYIYTYLQSYIYLHTYLKSYGPAAYSAQALRANHLPSGR